jgi:hypothetical protein
MQVGREFFSFGLVGTIGALEPTLHRQFKLQLFVPLLVL